MDIVIAAPVAGGRVGAAVSSERLRYVPAQARDVPPLEPEGTDLQIWKYEAYGQVFAIAFAGKANKPLWHNSFGTSDSRRQARIDATIESRKSGLEWKT